MKNNDIEPLLIQSDYIDKCDCIEGMKKLPDNCVDVVIADPPYNLSKSGDWKWDNSISLSGMGGNWNITNENWDDMTLEEYFNFSITWLREVKRILKPTGSLWIFGTYHNTGIINVTCQLLGIEIINEVVWYKKNAFPNLSGRRLTASHETILWGHTGGKKREYYFDYEYSKEGDFSDDDLKKPGKQMRTVWSLSNNKKAEELKYGKHPTQKPIKILTRIIKLSSKENDIVFTPFAGSGSECVAAKMTGRHYIGFEIEEEYCKIAEERLLHTQIEDCYQINLFQSVKETNKNV
jgi:site-specific DNA-methyltransferase (adenine-specific)